MKGFGHVTRKYLGKSFDECNCLGLLYSIYTDMGFDVPNSYKEYDLDTYMAYWEENPQNAIKDMMELFRTIGEETDTNFLKRGDIVVAEYKDSRFPSIYLGNNNIMVATKEQGVMVLPLGKRFKPVQARRLI